MHCARAFHYDFLMGRWSNLGSFICLLSRPVVNYGVLSLETDSFLFPAMTPSLEMFLTDLRSMHAAEQSNICDFMAGCQQGLAGA